MSDLKKHYGKCRGCGAEILWAKTLSGKNIPLDTKAPVFMVTMDEVEGQKKPMALGIKSGMVSHFSTCPDADKFSGGKRGEEES